MRRAFFFSEAFSEYLRQREDPEIKMPPDGIPLLPDEDPTPPVDTPPDQPRKPEDQPDPPPIREPDPTEPTRLFSVTEPGPGI
jgi:hypothetical protein